MIPIKALTIISMTCKMTRFICTSSLCKYHTEWLLEFDFPGKALEGLGGGGGIHENVFLPPNCLSWLFSERNSTDSVFT